LPIIETHIFQLDYNTNIRLEEGGIIMTKKNREEGRTIPISDEILREEFGSEFGDVNSHKTLELLEEVKRKKKK